MANKEGASSLLESIATGADQVKQDLLRATDGPKELGKALDIISPTGLGTLAGKASKLWKPIEAELASKLEELGSSAKQIWQNTGTYRGPIDNMLRQEIPDMAAALKPFKAVKDQAVKLGDMLEHSKLFEAYPQLKDVAVRPGKSFSYGRDAEGLPSMMVDAKMLKEKPAEFLNILLHETQHAVQKIEGFAKGGSPIGAQSTEAFKKAVKDMGVDVISDPIIGQKMVDRAATRTYQKFAGEAEARAVQARQHLDPADARNILPTELGPLGYDTALEQLIKAPK